MSEEKTYSQHIVCGTCGYQVTVTDIPFGNHPEDAIFDNKVFCERCQYSKFYSQGELLHNQFSHRKITWYDFLNEFVR